MEIEKTNAGIEIRLRLSMEDIPAALRTPFVTVGIVAAKTGLTRQHVIRLAPKVPGAYQLEVGRIWIFPYTAIEYIKTTKRPKTGRKIKENRKHEKN